MIVLIDNYDSFSYNVYQMLGSINTDIKVIRNDEMSVEEIRMLKPEAIVLSPGPGKPSNAGVCIQVAKELGKEIPLLGICLGHQAICEAYGATISYAKKLMHGKMSNVEIIYAGKLFYGMKNVIEVARYHSLAALEETMPEELIITAKTQDGEIMAVEHRDYPIYGVQFHPESILTLQGKQIVENFFRRQK